MDASEAGAQTPASLSSPKFRPCNLLETFELAASRFWPLLKSRDIQTNVVHHN